MRKFAVVIVMLGLTGCAVPVPPGTSDVSKLPVESQQKATTVNLVDSRPATAVSLGKLQASSCQRYQWDPEPTNDTALTMLKIAAAGKGANAVTGVSYSRSNISLAQNCYTTITATGEALTVK